MRIKVVSEVTLTMTGKEARILEEYLGQTNGNHKRDNTTAEDGQEVLTDIYNDLNNGLRS